MRKGKPYGRSPQGHVVARLVAALLPEPATSSEKRPPESERQRRHEARRTYPAAESRQVGLYLRRATPVEAGSRVEPRARPAIICGPERTGGFVDQAVKAVLVEARGLLVKGRKRDENARDGTPGGWCLPIRRLSAGVPRGRSGGPSRQYEGSSGASCRA